MLAEHILMSLFCVAQTLGLVQLDAGLQKQCMMAFSIAHKHHTSEE
jgi:hypothetical protein